MIASEIDKGLCLRQHGQQAEAQRLTRGRVTTRRGPWGGLVDTAVTLGRDPVTKLGNPCREGRDCGLSIQGEEEDVLKSYFPPAAL